MPNGSYVEVKGELSTKGSSRPPPIVYLGKIISFKGTGSLPNDATVDENGRFSSGFNVDKNIRKGLELQDMPAATISLIIRRRVAKND